MSLAHRWRDRLESSVTIRLVGNAFEGRRGKPLLGMQRHLMQVPNGPAPDADVARLFGVTAARPSNAVVISGFGQGAGSECESDSHGGFDNDRATMNSVLYRILGARPNRPFDTRDLQF